MDQTALYKPINPSLTIVGAENSTTHAVTVPAFDCPSDPMVGVARNLNYDQLARYGVPQPGLMVYTNYFGMIGSLSVNALPQPRFR